MNNTYNASVKQENVLTFLFKHGEAFLLNTDGDWVL